MLPPLYLITDRRQTNARPVTEVIEEALKGGAEMVQLREKDLSGKDLFELAGEMRTLTRRYGAKLLINDRIDIALAVDADGVHLPADSFSPTEARRLMGRDKLVGVSAHSIEEVKKAEKEGADFTTFSPVYFTASKAAYGNPLGTDRLGEVCRQSGIPVYALGGIKSSNVKEVMSCGAHGVALISAILESENVSDMTKSIVTRLREVNN